MADGRPRLLLVGGPHVQAGDLSVLLGGVFDVVVIDPRSAADAISSQGFAAVLAEADGYAPLERAMVGSRATLILNALSEGICLTDSDGQVHWSNRAFALYDATTRARIGAACRQAGRTLLDGGAHRGSDPRHAPRFDVVSADESRHFEVSVCAVPVPEPVLSAVPGANGEPPGIGGASAPPGGKHLAAVVWDVTTAKRVQQKMDAIDRAGAELVRLDAELIRKMNMVERLRLLEQKIVKFAHELLHFDHFAIRLVNEKTSKLELVMSCGLPTEAMEVELYARREGNGISGYVAATGRSYICADTSKDPRYVIGIDKASSSLTIPLRMSDKVIGVFNVESTQLNAFSEEDRQFGEMFATHMALALHILDLLVVERSTTGKAVTGTVEGELSEPLDDIALVAARLKQAMSGATDPALARFVERIMADVDSIKRRVKDVAAGPATILGAERSIAEAALDPILVGKRILVADDDARIRQIVRDVLRARGAEVVLCENGSAAIEVIKGCRLSSTGTAQPGQERAITVPGAADQARATGFHLLISDIKMPDITGYEIFSEARRVMPDVPVILMTGFGYDPHHSIVRASQEGLSCVLFKPFQAERLIEEVHKALAKKT